MRNHLLFLVFFLPFSASAQLYLSFAQTTTGPCQYDPATEVTRPTNWDIYQTIDDKWDSPIDSTKCFSVVDDGSIARLHLDDVDPARPLFFRANFDPFEMLPDWLFQVEFFMEALFGAPTLNTGTNCNGGLCSGMMVLLEIPNEAGTGTVLRQYSIPAFQEGPNLEMSTCMATERFGGIAQEFIVKLTFDEIDLSSSFYDLWTGTLQIAYGESTILPTEVFAQPSQFFGSEYTVLVSDLVPGGWFAKYLFPYPDTTYPSLQNIRYIDCRPEPNSAEKQVINITALEEETVVVQPFTRLRGDTVVGDTVRHTVNFINDGSEFCLGFGLDLIFEDDTHFLYGSGHVELSGPTSCIMFRKGASLTLLDDATLHYGQHGVGILGVSSDAKIHFGENSSLIIDNQFMLMDGGGQPEAILELELRTGQMLAFGENASLLRNPYNQNPVFLNVHMLGGTLDDANLTAEERLLINRIYPPAAENFADDVRIFPNPNSGVFSVEMNLPEAGTATATVSDPNGKLVFQKAAYFEKGIGQWPLETGLAAGVYFVEISAGERTMVEKVVVR